MKHAWLETQGLMCCKSSPTSVPCVLEFSVLAHVRVSCMLALALLVPLLVAPIARSLVTRRVAARSLRLPFVSQVRHDPVHILPHLIASLFIA